MGYNSGNWEFCKSGRYIHEDMMKKTSGQGIGALDCSGWMVSDDQVMHLATAEALLGWLEQSKEQKKKQKDSDEAEKDVEKDAFADLYSLICERYLACWSDMNGRAPGATTGTSIRRIASDGWDSVPFSSSAGGCGAAMRAMCIGLVFWRAQDVETLVRVAVESGRMTHNHPTGFLGAVGAAALTAFAVRDEPVVSWGRKLVDEVLPLAYVYLERSGRDFESYADSLRAFEEKWRAYLAKRHIDMPERLAPRFPKQFGVDERDKFYKSVSFSGWGGSSGDDAVLIAYDALLGAIFYSAGDAKLRWREFVARGILHGGDNDSTGAIGASIYGALFGLDDVPKHHSHVEYIDRAEQLAQSLFSFSQ
jgi:ADP-ribosylarginine hydrolase